MNEWKKASEENPPLDTPVWAGWFNVDGSFTSGLLVLADADPFPIWGRCDNSIPYDNFGILLDDAPYPVSHWMYLPAPPENQENAMAKIIIEIEDLPNGGVRYEPHGDLLILDGGTPAQLTWIAVQDVIYMLEKIGAMQVK